jgi:hypothetical protein
VMSDRTEQRNYFVKSVLLNTEKNIFECVSW